MSHEPGEAPRVSLPLGVRALFPILVGAAWMAFIGWWTLGFTAATSFTYAQRQAGTVPYAAPALALRDQDGNATDLEAVRGKHVLLSFMYMSCGTVCPANMMKFMTAHAALEDRVPDDLAFLSVSFDVERDDPASLHEIWKRHGSPAGWTMGVVDVDTWAASEQAVEAFGAAVQKDREGRFTHAGLVFLIDPQGDVIEVFDSQAPADDLIASVEARL